jgi:hypothetical protein
MTDLEGKKEETDAAKKVIHTYPLIRVSHDDMTVCYMFVTHFASGKHRSDLFRNTMRKLSNILNIDTLKIVYFAHF